MTLLSRLRGQAPSPTKTTGKISDSQLQSSGVVAGVNLDGEAEALRIASIEKMAAGDALFKLAGILSEENGGGVAQRAAQQRVATLVDAGAIKFAELTRPENIESCLSIAALCANPAYLQQTIASIGESTLLTKLATDAASSKVRQLTAEAITDPEQLKLVLKNVRSKDKNVYKIIKHKFDALHAQEKAATEVQASIDAVCAALERHVYHPFDNLFTPALEHFNSQWNALAAQASPEATHRAEQAIDHCREIITQHLQATASQAARAGAIANADTNRQEILSELRSTLSAIYAHDQITNVEQSLSQCVERWTEIANYKPASPAEQSSFSQLRKAIKDLSAMIAHHGSVSVQAERFRETPDSAITDGAPPDATRIAATDLVAYAQELKKTLTFAALLGDAVPTVVTDAVASLQAWEQSRHDQQAAEANALRQLSGLLRKAGGMLNEGKTGAAAGLRRAIEERLRALPVTPAHLTAQIHALDEKLNLLQDWRSYAVAPKRIELIEQMEGLIGAEESPQILADNIKRLQDEWKLISKGNIENTDAEWQRFHQAAQTAYQPCRDYFSVQAKQREGNLSKRMALLTRLTNFVAAQNGEYTDWREMARALRESKQQWRNYQPVERAANKPLQKNFDALTKDLESRLEAESAKNADEKKALIARAKRLIDGDDGRQAIDEIKRMQLAWKNVGIVAREDDQKLWAEFREHCDAVFAKRQQAHTAYTAAMDESKNKAIALCVEAEQVLTLSGAELLEGAKKLSALSELFEAVGELPKSNARDLHLRFERALNQCEKRVAQQRTRDKAQAWNHVLDAGDQIRLYRLAVIEGANEEECAARKKAVQTFIEAVQHWPKGGLQAVKAEMAKPGAIDLTANENALRTLCVRAEILTDTPTLAADHQFRRNYQVQRLMQGIGQGGGSIKEELDAMVLEWISVGVTKSDVYAPLLERFARCRDQHQKHQ